MLCLLEESLVRRINVDVALLRCIVRDAARLVETINSPDESQLSIPGARQASYQICAYFSIDRRRQLTDFAIKLRLSAAYGDLY
jgi:hypothetical protein